MKCGTRITQCGMVKKSILVTGLVLLGFGFNATTNAGTEVIRDYSNEAPVYNNYAPQPPPPRPIYYAPPPPIGVAIYPRYYGPRFRVFARHRFHPHRIFWRRF